MAKELPIKVYKVQAEVGVQDIITEYVEAKTERGAIAQFKLEVLDTRPWLYERGGYIQVVETFKKLPIEYLKEYDRRRGEVAVAEATVRMAEEAMKRYQRQLDNARDAFYEAQGRLVEVQEDFDNLEVPTGK